MQILSQGDKRWSKFNLGASTLTVGRFGCTTTCISMLSDYFGCYVSPDKLAKDVSHYTKDGLVIWQAFVFKKMKFVVREHGEKRQNIIAAIKDPDMAVILQVDNGRHWVAAMGVTKDGKDYIVADPWFGKKVNAKAVYKNVTGAAYFERI